MRGSFPFAIALLSSLLLALPTPAQQAQQDQDPAAIEHYTATRWSMIRPNRDFQGGCVVGFLAFQFSPLGYFSYNNHIRGSWRIDEIGNLKLRTRDGQGFTLIVEGDTLRSTNALTFIKRTDLFQRCPE